MSRENLIVDLSRYAVWCSGSCDQEDRIPPVFRHGVEVVYPSHTMMAGSKLWVMDAFKSDNPALFSRIVRHEGVLWAIFSGAVRLGEEIDSAWLARPVAPEDEAEIRELIDVCIAPRHVAAEQRLLRERADRIGREMCLELIRRIPESFERYVRGFGWRETTIGWPNALSRIVNDVVRADERGEAHVEMIHDANLDFIEGASRADLLSAAEGLRQAWAGVIDVSGNEHPEGIALHFKLPSPPVPVT